MKRFFRCKGNYAGLAVVLCVLIGLPQSGLGAPQQEAPAPAKLNIVVVEGEGAINNIRQRTAREVIVQVEDENHRPIAGAAVLFMLPSTGPSGTFTGGGGTLQATTDKLGRAATRGFRVNNVPGKFQVQVQASYQGVTATTSIAQVNAALTAAAAGAISGKLIAILAVAGAAAAGGAVALTRDKDKPPPPPPSATTISAGASSVNRP